MDLEKLDKFILEDDFDSEDDILMDKMLDFITGIDAENLTEDQAEQVLEIIDLIDDDEDEDEVSEVFKKRVKRDLKAARKRRREYRTKRSKMRLKAKRYRRSAAGKMTLRKAKRYKKFGKTSTMKRQRKFVGPKLSRLK